MPPSSQTRECKYSLVMPIHNAGSYLPQALAPLTSLDDLWELVLVDDGSSDQSARIVTELLPSARLVRLDRPHGPAFARNKGAETSRGEILIFVDSDVETSKAALDRIVAQLEAGDSTDGVFGSYDAEPRCPAPVSKFRNLLHHYVHSRCPGPVPSFWAGFGAIRKQAFLSVGGFDHTQFARPSVEDVEMGFRLWRAGFEVRLQPEIQVKHLKSWSLGNFLRTDIFQRARPWTKLILDSQGLANNLNLSPELRRPPFLLFLFMLSTLASFLPGWSNAALLCLYLLANWRVYAFMGRHGLGLRSVPLLALHHIGAGVGALFGLLDWVGDRLK